ncbi:MAG: hypothetical protein RIQ89_2054 [Bacteroidota bacterium]
MNQFFRTSITNVLAVGLMLLMLLGIYAGSALKMREDDFNLDTTAQEISTKLSNSDKAFFNNSNDLFGARDLAEFLEVSRNQPPLGSIYCLEVNSKLLFWNSNLVVPPPTPLKGLQQLGNGYYYSNYIHRGDSILYMYIPIQQSYSYSNKFLKNDFNPALTHHAVQISFTDANKSVTVGKVPIFKIEQVDKAQPAQSGFLFFAFLAIALFLLYTMVYRGLLPLSLGYAALGLLIVLKWLLIYHQWPAVIVTLKLFSPSYYGSNLLFNSLGALVLNIIIGYFFLSLFLLSIAKNKDKQTFVLIANLIAALLPLAISYISLGVIINSNFSFDVSSIVDINRYAVLAVVCIFIMVYGYFIYCYVLFQKQVLKPWSILVALIVLFLSMSYWELASLVLAGFLLLGFMVLYFISNKSSYRSISFGFLMVVYAALSITMLFFFGNKQKLNDQLELQSAKLAQKEDRVAEYLFAEMVDEINEDTLLNHYINHSASFSIIDQYLQQAYFNGYFSKFNIKFLLLDSSLQSYNQSASPEEIQRIIAIGQNADYNTVSRNMVAIDNGTSKLTYLAGMNLNETTAGHKLVIVLEQKSFHQMRGYPSLLVSGKVSRGVKSNFDYSVYEKGRLVEHNGFHEFPTILSSSFLKKENIYHYTQKDTEVLIALSDQWIYTVVSLFSYLLLMSVLVALMGFVSIKFLFERQVPVWIIVVSMLAMGSLVLKAYLLFLLLSGIAAVLIYKTQLSLRLSWRIHTNVLVLLTASLITAGLLTLGYLQIKFDQANHSQLLKSLQQIASAIGQTSAQAVLNDVHFNQVAINSDHDFNIFSIDGSLLYTSQPKLFSQKIIAPVIEPKAFQELLSGSAHYYTQHEQIGSLDYLAAYTLVERDTAPILLQLPYFERVEDKNRELSSFISVFANLYVFLFVIAMVIAYLLSMRITRPLSLLSEKMGNMRLGAFNEKLEWHSNDEIGHLVNAYNKLVDQLKESLTKLAAQERSIAWQEMARQVAHEIKNPLTPMKLQLQHLQRVVNNGDVDPKAMIKSVSENLLVQIDALSNIATAFSDFANMPHSKLAAIDYRKSIDAAVDLFAAAHPGIIQLTDEVEEPFSIVADQDQLLRVMTNLLKNALQAVEAVPDPAIKINLRRVAEGYCILVKDNGCGIPPSDFSKIFTPNFSTKSSGSGLGLAMCHKIIESHRGSITFKSIVSAGTEFSIILPLGAIN